MEKSAASLLTFHFHAALRSIKLSHQDLCLLHLSALQITQTQGERERHRQLGRQLDSQKGEGYIMWVQSINLDITICVIIMQFVQTDCQQHVQHVEAHVAKLH